ncbi:hypothetical protein FPV67DRAFT_1460855 [Lyophyllum atratum]|nr:hypothetical protein FPV67DRAFT_1460855 [Lyophyllum atratum]
MEKLAAETLHLIIKEVNGSSGLDGVLTLTKVCRFVRPSAQQLYYRAITFDRRDPQSNHTPALTDSSWLMEQVQEVRIILRRGRRADYRDALDGIPRLRYLRWLKIEMDFDSYWESIDPVIRQALVRMIHMPALGTLQLYNIRVPSNFFSAPLSIHTLSLNKAKVGGTAADLRHPLDNDASTPRVPLKVLHLENMPVSAELLSLFQNRSSGISLHGLVTLHTWLSSYGPTVSELQSLLDLTAGHLEGWEYLDPGVLSPITYMETLATLPVDIEGLSALRRIEFTCGDFKTIIETLKSALGLNRLESVVIHNCVRTTHSNPAARAKVTIDLGTFRNTLHIGFPHFPEKQNTRNRLWTSGNGTYWRHPDPLHPCLQMTRLDYRPKTSPLRRLRKSHIPKRRSSHIRSPHRTPMKLLDASWKKT